MDIRKDMWAKFELVIKFDSNKFYLQGCEFYDTQDDSIGQSRAAVVDCECLSKDEMAEALKRQLLWVAEQLMTNSKNLCTQLVAEKMYRK